MFSQLKSLTIWTQDNLDQPRSLLFSLHQSRACRHCYVDHPSEWSLQRISSNGRSLPQSSLTSQSTHQRTTRCLVLPLCGLITVSLLRSSINQSYPESSTHALEDLQAAYAFPYLQKGKQDDHPLSGNHRNLKMERLFSIRRVMSRRRPSRRWGALKTPLELLVSLSSIVGLGF